tara:strand:- start:9232 stop:9576 length:345 start_codon:yes stop_codon:yes gene_type:complete
MGFPNMSSEGDNIEIIAGNIAADGSVTAGKGFSVAKSGTSLFTLTLDREYNGLVSAQITPFHTSGDVIGVVDAVSAFPAAAPGATVAFQTYDGDGTTEQACPFYFILILTRGDA